MIRPRRLRGGRTRRSGYTWIELIVVVVVLAVLLALLIPSTQMAREAARRATCTKYFMFIGLAAHNYSQANGVLPPGTVCSTGPAPQNRYGVWGEAAKSGAGYDGTSFLVRLRPFNSGGSLTGGVGLNAGVQNAPGPAAADDPSLYCPTRRNALRPGDSAMLPATWWPGGGTDFGGCVGRHVAYDTSSPNHNVLDARGANAIVFDPVITVSNVGTNSNTYRVAKDNAASRWGVFGRINVSTTFAEITDGTSNTIMTGEMQRIRISDTQHGGANNLSHDGWVVGGDATGFTTGYGGPAIKINGEPTPLMNNGFFQSPGSEHVGGANFGMADGTVRFLNQSIDPNVFAILGSMADNVAFQYGRLDL
jgi:prepilin-type N-terminal cleavage/methylation domain-containing protein